MENIECEYEGWTNWETRTANLWMTDAGAWKVVRDIKALREFWIDIFEDGYGGAEDIQTAKINFEEIFYFNRMNEED